MNFAFSFQYFLPTTLDIFKRNIKPFWIMEARKTKKTYFKAAPAS